jgi:hypothetical protein
VVIACCNGAINCEWVRESHWGGMRWERLLRNTAVRKQHICSAGKGLMCQWLSSLYNAYYPRETTTVAAAVNACALGDHSEPNLCCYCWKSIGFHGCWAHPKWHPIPYIVLYFWPEPFGPCHYLGHRVSFGMKSLFSCTVKKYMIQCTIICTIIR